MELRLKIQRWIVGCNSQNWVGGNYPAKLKYKEKKVSLSKKEPHEFFLFHNIFSQISSKYKIQKTWNTQKKFEKKKKTPEFPPFIINASLLCVSLGMNRHRDFVYLFIFVLCKSKHSLLLHFIYITHILQSKINVYRVNKCCPTLQFW